MRTDGERFLLQAPRDTRNQKTWRQARLMSGYLAQSADTILLYFSHRWLIHIINSVDKTKLSSTGEHTTKRYLD